MPQQGDPQQQKMMLYMMPAIFTVMMLFLPAGLGMYMLTNTVLGIGTAGRSSASPRRGRPDIEVRDRDDADKTGGKGSGKKRLRQAARSRALCLRN